MTSHFETIGSLTDEQKIAYLAEKVMGWKKETQNADGCLWHFWTVNDIHMIETGAWNPLQSWDDWRQVEEKVMEDRNLFNNYIVTLAEDGMGEDISKTSGVRSLIESPLPTRVDALIAAHSSLTIK